MSNKYPVGDCSRRPNQPHKMPGYRVVVSHGYGSVAAFWRNERL